MIAEELIGKEFDWPNDGRLRVLSVGGEYDDDTTRLRLDGPYAGSETDRDTFAVRRHLGIPR